MNMYGGDFMISVKYDNLVYDVEEGTKVIDFIRKNLTVNEDSIMACKIFNEVKSLDFQLEKDTTLQLIDTTTSDGNRIYVRGLTFIMLKAFEELYPEVKLLVDYALSHSLYCEAASDVEITNNMIEKVTEKMQEIVSKDLPFEKHVLPLEEAKEIYKKNNRYDKIELMENRTKSYVSIYSCGDTYNYFNGVMPISTKYMKYFRIEKYENGILLIYPRKYSPTEIIEVKETKKLYRSFEEYEKIHRVLNVSNVTELNHWIKSGNIGELIRISEALHEKKIAQIADKITEDPNKRIVLIAGPSSSGKTTFAQRLGIQLRVNGIRTITLSMDNYFVDRHKTPKDENGNYDFECLEAIDIPLFNEQLNGLLNNEEVDLPMFDFETGTRKYPGNKVKLHENEIVVVEGIHGLNENLTKEIPRENKFKIYISALTTLNIDDCNRVSTADSRLIRRILRDYKYRGHGAIATLKMWPSVRNGEEKYIFPFQEDADMTFNSSLVYEQAVLKSYLEPILAAVGHDTPEFSEAKRLYEFLGYFLPVPTDEIPINSIIREFIGGGCFYR